MGSPPRATCKRGSIARRRPPLPIAPASFTSSSASPTGCAAGSTTALREFDAAATQQPAGSDLLLLRALTLEAAGRTADAGAAFNAAFAAGTASPVKAYYAVRA